MSGCRTKHNDKEIESIRYNNCRYEPSIGVFKYIKNTLTNIQEIDSNTIIERGCITPLTSIAYPDRKSENIDLKWHILFDGLNRCIEDIQSKNNIDSFQVHREHSSG